MNCGKPKCLYVKLYVYVHATTLILIRCTIKYCLRFQQVFLFRKDKLQTITSIGMCHIIQHGNSVIILPVNLVIIKLVKTLVHMLYCFVFIVNRISSDLKIHSCFEC